MSDVLRQHYVKLAQILSVSQETLIPLSGSCYQEHLIDLPSKTAITRASSQTGANTLLDLLQMKIEHSQEKDYLSVVLKLMAKHTALVDVVVEMETKLAKEKNRTAEIHRNETEVMRLVRTDGGMMNSEVGQSDVLKKEEVYHDKGHCDVLPKQKKLGHLPESNLINCPLPPVVGYDDEIFLNPPTDLQCPICKFTLRQPHQVTCCGATMCQACAVKTGAEMQCPCCRDTDHSMMVDKKTRGQIMSLKVKCPNADCHWSGELLDLESHKSKGCPKPIDRDLLESEDSELGQKLVKTEPLLFLNTGIQCPPVTIMMSNFSNWKKRQDHWFGPAFYSHPGGYKLCLKVRPSGQEEGEGTHVSVYAHIMSGENDQKLQWPFRGKIKLQLLNQRADRKHIDGEIDFSILGKEDAGARVSGGLGVPSGTAAEIGKGVVQLVKHEDLNYSPDRGTEYLREDAVLIHVKEVIVAHEQPSSSAAVAVAATTKPTATFTDVEEFTLQDFSKQKAKNGKWQKKFYTHSKGYQFMLIVHANGKDEFKGKSISVFTHLMKGNHDDNLKFPFRGIITVRLINQKEDKNHVECRIKYTEETDPKGKKGGRITTWSLDNLVAGRSYNGWGYPNFVRHEFLSYDADRNTQYLTDNKLEIKISRVDIFTA